MAPDAPDTLPLSALLSQALVAFTIECEAHAPVSLAVAADVVRVVEEGGTALRDLPARSGVAKEGLARAAGWLERRGLAVTEPVPGAGRGRQIRLTARGGALRPDYPERCAVVERGWRKRLGAGTADDLRGALEPMIGDGTPGGSPLWAGLVPYPDGWRASVRPPGRLPHFPMVLHRGGFPDGS
jgi:DNA-binding MarR family transcriptional regulator